ncbi:MAG: NAD(P)-dependent oxidoreductase, partial [Anaerolineales bacterium]
MQHSYRLLVADAISEAGVAALAAGADTDVRTDILPEQLLADIAGYDALVVRSRTKVTPAVVAAGDRLKVVGRAGVGVDNIDLDACREHGVTVVNSPLAASIAVAELTLSLMLALARSVPRADMVMKQGNWIKKQLKGVELYGKTLGLVAVGRIGAAVAERAVAFGMRVLAFDPYLTPEQVRERHAEPAALDEVLQQSDYISIHSPLTAETR